MRHPVGFSPISQVIKKIFQICKLINVPDKFLEKKNQKVGNIHIKKCKLIHNLSKYKLNFNSIQLNFNESHVDCLKTKVNPRNSRGILPRDWLILVTCFLALFLHRVFFSSHRNKRTKFRGFASKSK